MKINHTGFCLDEFDTKECKNCPTLKECLIMYGKDQVKKVINEMKLEKRGQNEKTNFNFIGGTVISFLCNY